MYDQYGNAFTNAYSALAKFADFVIAYPQQFGNADHVALFTGFVLLITLMYGLSTQIGNIELLIRLCTNRYQ